MAAPHLMPTIESFTARPDFERERVAMGMTVGVGFLLGGLLGLAAMLLPVPEALDVRGIVILGSVCVVLGAIFLLLGERMPLWGFHVASVAGLAAITASIVLNADPAANNELFYLYGAGFVFYFFAWCEASGYALLAMVLYGWAEARITDVPVEPTSLLIFAGCLLMLGVLLRIVGGRSRALLLELGKQATTDDLTGLLNRRGLQRIADAEMQRSSRSGRPFSLLIGDLDHFKTVNDRLGHMGGDMALERVAARLNSGRRAIDSVARIGGEEFAILMPETGSEGAEIAAERFRERISATFEDSPVELTMSIGVASYPRDAQSWEQILDAADRALYEAKDGGRDQVVVVAAELPALVT